MSTMTTETISLDDLDIDFSAAQRELPDPGQYLFMVDKVKDARREPNRYYNIENARRPYPGEPRKDGEYPVQAGDPYIDKTSGYWVYPTRTSILIELRPLADSREDFNDLAAIYCYFDLAPRREGGYRPGKQMRELIAACYGENTMKSRNAASFFRDLEGATCWGLLAHQKAKNSDKVYGKVTDFTDQAPQRYLSRTAGRGHAAVPEPRYPEPGEDWDEVPSDAGADDSDRAGQPTTQEWIDYLTASDTAAVLAERIDEARQSGALSPSVNMAVARVQTRFRADARATGALIP